jgi:TldD protein
MTDMRELCSVAIEAARAAGAQYADVRIARYRWQDLRARDRRLDALSERESFGAGVRVLAGTPLAWGFAATSTVTRDDLARAARLAAEIARASALARKEPVRWLPERAYEDRYETPHRIEPLAVPLDRKIATLLDATDRCLRVRGVSRADAFLSFAREEKFYMNTDGSYIEQVIHRAHCGLTATAVGDGGFESRSYQVPPLNIGYEHIEAADLPGHAERVAHEAVEKLSAAPPPAGEEKDLILMPSHLMLTIHESIAHPTELDRALGWEADYAGTTFCTPDKLGRFRYGSPLLNVVADRTMPHGRSTVGYDDDGVPAKRWYIIRAGDFVGYQTTRDTAPYIGETESTGCAYADSWGSYPLLRIPNISIEADPNGPDLEDLIADTRDGILIEGRGSYSIDQQRLNFQFGGDAFWEIKNGRRTRMLKDVTYHAMTTEFWSALDAVCNERFWEPHGVTNDGKGQPGQAAQQTHGCPPCRFRRIRIGGSPR